MSDKFVVINNLITVDKEAIEAFKQFVKVRQNPNDYKFSVPDNVEMCSRQLSDYTSNCNGNLVSWIGFSEVVSTIRFLQLNVTSADCSHHLDTLRIQLENLRDLMADLRTAHGVNE